MLKKIYSLLPEEERRKSVWVALSVLLRALLDFAGLAALLPVLIAVLGEDADRMKALLLCAGALLFITLKNGVNVLLSRHQMAFMLRLYRHFSYRMLSNYYQRGLLFMKSKSSVQLAHEVNVLCYAFSISVLQPILAIAAEGVLIVLMVVGLLLWEPLAGGILCLGFLPMVFVYVRVIKKRVREYGRSEMEARRQQSRNVVEAFRGYPELEVNNAFGTILDRFEKGLAEINASRMRMDMVKRLPAFMSEAAVVIGLAILLMVTNNDLKLVSGVFAVAAFKLIPAVRGIMDGWTSIQSSSFCIEVVAEGIGDSEELGVRSFDLQKAEESLSFEKEISVEDLGFAFPDGGVILKHFNCQIGKGERVGFRGESGSGKSTLFNILLGFYPATSGRVAVDGVTLDASRLKAWHQKVGYVPQEIFIIKGNLAENVALGHKTIDEKRVWQVLEQVQLREWVESLPEGIYSDLGEYGSRMSGGQKQRIGIARALYKQAEVLFFDEATSALDNKTEREINEAIEHLSQTRKELTILVIAHRESSLGFCDRVISLSSVSDIK